MPNTSTCESKCFHLDYQTNAPSSLRVILCSQNFKENECTLKTTFLSTKKMTVIRFATFCVHQVGTNCLEMF